MKILFILQYVPYPLNSGGNQAMFNMLDYIRNFHDISVLFYLKSKQEEDALTQLRKIWKNVQFYSYTAEYLHSRPKQEKGKQPLPNTLSFRLLHYIHQSTGRKLNRRIRKYKRKHIHVNEQNIDFVRQHSCIFNEIPALNLPKHFKNYVYEISRKGFDIIQTEFYECLSLVYLLPENVIKVFVQHEIRFVRNHNEMELFQKQFPEDIFRYQLHKDFELKALSRYDKVIALTDTDKQIMQPEIPDTEIYVSPAAVTLPATQFDFKSQATELVFIGSGFHFPNADGVMWFCTEVMPLLHAKGIHTKLYVMGNWEQEIRTKLQNASEDICFTGFIDDLQAFTNGKISIIPIRIGSGMRMKILDSIFSMSPIITTSKGCEGLPLVNGTDCHIADSPQAFADAICNLLNHPEQQEHFAACSYEKFKNMLDTHSMQEKRKWLYDEFKK